MVNWLLIAISTVLLALLVTIGLALPPVLRFLLIAQSLYWALAYVARPAVMLIYEPVPRIGDNISDPRLFTPAYAETLTPILQVTTFGLGCYVVTWALIARAVGRRAQRARESGHQARLPTSPLIIIWIIGWVARLTDAYIAPSGVMGTLALLASAGAIGVIFTSQARGSSRSALLLTVVLFGEVAWSFATATKTPALAALIAICLRQLSSGWTKRTSRTILISSFLVLVSFSSFQAYKLGDEATRQFEAAVSSDYPQALAGPLTILRRFDLMSAVTDAVYYPNPQWLSVNQGLQKAIRSATPAPLVDKTQNAGRAWNEEVRSASIPDAKYSDVSLAEGYIAEGYLLGGRVGILLEAWFIIALTIFIYYFVTSKRTVLLLWGLLLLTYPTLFERGLYGNIELASKTAQVAIIGSLIIYIDSQLARRHRPQGRPYEQVDTEDRDSSESPISRSAR